MSLLVSQDTGRPTSNPLPPQSEAFADYTKALTSEHVNVAQQVPNFGTEQVCLSLHHNYLHFSTFLFSFSRLWVCNIVGCEFLSCTTLLLIH